MAWTIKYHPIAKEELAKLDGSVRKIVLKGYMLKSSYKTINILVRWITVIS